MTAAVSGLPLGEGRSATSVPYQSISSQERKSVGNGGSGYILLALPLRRKMVSL